jgi:hypothetical protein
MLTGTVAGSPLAGPYGELAGAPAAISLGYTTATPMTLNNAVVLIAGRVVSYGASAGGTITFPAGPPTPPPPSGAPTVVIRPIPETAFPIVRLDATGSTNPAGGALTYQWRVIAGQAGISTPTAAATDVYLLGLGAGDYTFEVTVTNSAGQSTSQRITVRKL